MVFPATVVTSALNTLKPTVPPANVKSAKSASGCAPATSMYSATLAPLPPCCSLALPVNSVLPLIDGSGCGSSAEITQNHPGRGLNTVPTYLALSSERMSSLGAMNCRSATTVSGAQSSCTQQG